MSLRARVLIRVLALTTLAMAGLGVVVYSFLGRYLTQRVDEDLQRSSLPIIGYVQRGFIPPDRPDERGFSQPRYYTAVRDAGGTVVKASPVMAGIEPLAAPDLSGVRTVDRPQGVDYLTTDSVDGSPSYRVQVTQLNNGTAVIVAAPLTDVEDTLTRLVTVEILATVTVLVALGGLVTWVVRRGLRPLGDVVVAADAVAGGDLSHRVPVPSPRTEVGHLGVAFNTMVDRIEESFAERDELEQRLRRFVADPSHELRTPLTSIRGYAELFRRGAAQDPAQLALAMRRIKDEASRMGVLVDDLLLLAPLHHGRA